MRRRFFSGLFLFAAMAAFSIPVTAQAPDSWLGTWKLNVAKSKWDSGSSAPKSQTVTQVAIAGGGMKSTVDMVDSQGKAIHTELTTMFDGKPANVTGAADAKTTRVYKRIDKQTYEFATLVNGKVTSTTRSVTSADGKTRTVTASGKNAQSVAYTNVVVYEKQKQ